MTDERKQELKTKLAKFLEELIRDMGYFDIDGFIEEECTKKEQEFVLGLLSSAKVTLE